MTVVPGARRQDVPQALDTEVVRPRLLERLRGHSQCRVVVLAAPSGYGKTTLVAQAVRGAAAIWLQLVPDDADVVHFAQSLLEAVQGASADQGHLAVSPGAAPLSVLAETIRATLRRLDALEIVLDNMECLSQEARSWLSDVLSANLGAARFWLIGYDLEHLRLARLVGRGEAVVLTQDDLRFDAEETQQVLAAHQSSENPDEVLERLGGWPAGVGLIALGISPLITPTDLIFDAISQLPPGLRGALPEAAVLDIWSESAAQALGCQLPPGWLAEVRRSGLPLTQVGAEVYRPHQTLQGALEQQLMLSSGRHRILHLAAAHRAQERGELLSAIRHCLLAADRDAAQQLAETFALRLSARGEHNLVRRVLGEIGPPLSAGLSGLLGVALIETGEAQDGERLLKAMLSSDVLTPSAVFALGKLALRRGQAQHALHYARLGIRLPGSTLELVRCRLLAGWAQLNLGKLEVALQCAEVEVARADAEQRDEELAAALRLASTVYAALGDHPLRERSLHRAIGVLDRLGDVGGAATARNSLADLYRVQGQFAAALSELHRAIADVRHLEHEALPYLHETLGDVYLWQALPEQAAAAYREAIKLARRLGHSAVTPRMQLRLVGAMLRTAPQEAWALLDVLADVGEHEGLRAFMTGLALFDSQPEQAETWLSGDLGKLESEWVLRAAALRSALAHRAGRLAHPHAEALIQAAEAHGFETALLIDLPSTAPALRAMLQVGWLPSQLRDVVERGLVDLPKAAEAPPISPAAPERVRLDVQTLGQRRVLVNGAPVEVHLAKSFELLVFLLRCGPSSREGILDAIWNSDSPQSREYFKVALRRLRADLSAHPAVDFGAVTFTRHYEVAASFAAHLDLTELEAAVTRPYEPALDILLSSTQGEFLPGAAGEWAEEQRELALEYRLLGQLKVGGALLSTEPHRAAQAFRAALALDPYSGECLVNLASALLRAGESVLARQEAERYTLSLRRELMLAPDPETQARLAELGLV